MTARQARAPVGPGQRPAAAARLASRPRRASRAPVAARRRLGCEPAMPRTASRSAIFRRVADNPVTARLRCGVPDGPQPRHRPGGLLGPSPPGCARPAQARPRPPAPAPRSNSEAWKVFSPGSGSSRTSTDGSLATSPGWGLNLRRPDRALERGSYSMVDHFTLGGKVLYTHYTRIS